MSVLDVARKHIEDNPRVSALKSNLENNRNLNAEEIWTLLTLSFFEFKESVGDFEKSAEESSNSIAQTFSKFKEITEKSSTVMTKLYRVIAWLTGALVFVATVQIIINLFN